MFHAAFVRSLLIHPARRAQRNDVELQEISMKSDQELKHDVEQELLWDPALDARNVTVAVLNRVVTLEGSVGSCAQKLVLQKAVQRVAGSRAVELDLVVRAPFPQRHSDEDLAAAILSALQWQEGLPANAIHVLVEHGCVTLTGTVEYGYQRQAAEVLVTRMRGVVDLANQIEVRVDPLVADVSRQIAEALQRRSRHESAGISVDVHDGVVRLTGTVDSLLDKRVACGVAWGTKGVRWVVDQMEVA
jgi:osmotically-inducible protein OsmY